MSRVTELSANLTEVRGRLSAACSAAGRKPSEVTLLAVTKFWPASDVLALHSLGLNEFGEAREPEASRKVATVEAAIGSELVWHMIGRLQTNKAKSIAKWAQVVHSVDSQRHIDALQIGREAASVRDPIDVLLQLSLDGDPSRGGVVAADLPRLADAVGASSHLRLAGLMAVPPVAAQPERAFAEIAQVYAEFRARYPAVNVLSAGMSADLEIAVNYGSTCVRVGTALLGPRPLISNQPQSTSVTQATNPA